MEHKLMERIKDKLEHRIVDDYQLKANQSNEYSTQAAGQPIDTLDDSVGPGDIAFSNETTHDDNYKPQPNQNFEKVEDYNITSPYLTSTMKHNSTHSNVHIQSGSTKYGNMHTISNKNLSHLSSRFLPHLNEEAKANSIEMNSTRQLRGIQSNAKLGTNRS